MIGRLRTILTLASAVVIATSAAARGDEIRQVTSGQIVWVTPGEGTFVLGGDGFSLSGGLSSGQNPYGFFPQPLGGSFEMQLRWLGGDIRSGLGTSGTVDGTTYHPLFLDGDLALHTGTIVIPPTGANGTLLTLTTPFTFARGANIVGYSSSPYGPEPPALFRFGLSGGGTAAITIGTMDGLAHHVETVLTFAPSASAVPEPASLLLTVTGVAAAAAARRRQRRQRRVVSAP